jgi:NAD(P)H-quinone oxidoreductase subunit 4L
MLDLTVVLTGAALLFGIGLYGALVLKNAIRVLMCIELMLNAVNINLIAFSRYLAPAEGRGMVFSLFVMAVAAAEAAIGLAIILSLARRRDRIDVHEFDTLKW